jgi:hypothetical protein
VEGSGVGALALGPGGAGLEDEPLAAAQAVGGGVGVGIVLGEAGLVDPPPAPFVLVLNPRSDSSPRPSNLDLRTPTSS